MYIQFIIKETARWFFDMDVSFYSLISSVQIFIPVTPHPQNVWYF